MIKDIVACIFAAVLFVIVSGFFLKEVANTAKEAATAARLEIEQKATEKEQERARQQSAALNNTIADLRRRLKEKERMPECEEILKINVSACFP